MYRHPPIVEEVAILRAEIERLRAVASEVPDHELATRINAAIKEMERRLTEIGDKTNQTPRSPRRPAAK
jgi:hypothetical protein